MSPVAQKVGQAGHDSGSNQKDRQARAAFLFLMLVLAAALVTMIVLPFLG